MEQQFEREDPEVSSTPLSAREVSDRYFLEVRCKLLEIAATLDRIDRAAGGDEARADRRQRDIRRALAILGEDSPDRAERIQLVFSRAYDPNWLKDQTGHGIH